MRQNPSHATHVRMMPYENRFLAVFFVFFLRWVTVCWVQALGFLPRGLEAACGIWNAAVAGAAWRESSYLEG